MKRSKITISIFCALALTFSSCSSDSDVVSDIKTPGTTNTETDLTFTGVIESDDATRITMSNSSGTWSTVWNTTDGIRVFNSSGNIANFVVSAVDDNQVATFTRDANAENESLGESAPYYAVYSETPLDLTIEFNGVISGSIPSVYTSGDLSGIEVSTSGGFNLKYRYMFAVADANNQFAFKNIMSFVRIKVKSTTNFPISMVKIVANNQEKIAGSFSANFNNGSVNIDKPTTGSSYIEIPVTDNNAHEYLIPIIPQTLSKGFTLLLETPFNTTNQSQRIYQRVMSGSFTFARNKVLDLGDYTNVTTGILEDVVDLGLSDATLWSTKNITGSYIENSQSASKKNLNDVDFVSSVETLGDYYSWAETYTKDDYPYTQPWLNNKVIGSYSFYNGNGPFRNVTYQSYLYGMGACNWLTSTLDYSKSYAMISGNLEGLLSRYNSSSDYNSTTLNWFAGVVDNVSILATDDDVAYKANNRYVIPTSGQFADLLKSSNTSIAYNGTNKYYTITSKTYTDRFIVLPAGGYKHMTSKSDNNNAKNTTTACYWTKNRSEAATDSYKAVSYVISTSNGTSTGESTDADRCQGRLVRAVVMNNAIAPANTYADLKRTPTQRQ